MKHISCLCNIHHVSHAEICADDLLLWETIKYIRHHIVLMGKYIFIAFSYKNERRSKAERWQVWAFASQHETPYRWIPCGELNALKPSYGVLATSPV